MKMGDGTMHWRMVQSTLLFFAISILCAAYVLPANSDLENGIGQDELECGIEMMQVMGVPDCPPNGVCWSWSFPTSVVVKGTVYPLRLSPYVGEFRLISPTNSETTVLSGQINRFKNSQVCRRACFGKLAMSSLGIMAMAHWTTMTRPFADTNVLYLTRPYASGRIGVLGCGNISVTIISSTVTNLVDFSVSLMNAGLPEAERLHPPHHNP